MKRWLVAVMVLINGVAWWWLDAQRAGRLAAPPPEIDAFQPAAAPAPKLLLLREVAPEPSAPQVADAAPDSGAATSAGGFRQPIDLAEPPLPPTTEPGPATAKGVTPELAAGAPPPVECLLLGNLDRGQLVAWRKALRAAGLAVADAIALTQQEVIAGYRVYLPLSPEHRSQVETLRSAGIEALIVAEPDTAQRISAGVFKVRANALRRQQQLANLGYAAQIRPMRRQSTSFWVQVRGPTGLTDRVAALLDREPRGAEAILRPCTATLLPATREKGSNPARHE